jgi:hypothetical protein
MFSQANLEARIPASHPLRKRVDPVPALTGTGAPEEGNPTHRQTGQIGDRNRYADALGRLISSKSASRMRTVGAFSMVCQGRFMPAASFKKD